MPGTRANFTGVDGRPRGGEASARGSDLSVAKNGKREKNGKPASEGELESLVKRLLSELGEDPSREGLRKTPHRVAESLRFLTRGCSKDLEDVLNGAIYEESVDEMVVVRDIELYSMCEHHMLPFFGKCHVAYLPKGKIIGLSKIPRIVDCFARRLQVQERLTVQIATALQEALGPAGVGVVIEAQHLCMMMRGVEKQNSLATTSCLLGRLRDDEKTRAEFLTLIHKR
ncbi:GTP cyclohydrolase I FolE [bacterium]|nr:GTP cyclohydrolase I FolE [bacterium]